MAHDKVFGHCENLCNVEVPSKDTFDNSVGTLDSRIDDVMLHQLCEDVASIDGSSFNKNYLKVSLSNRYALENRRAMFYQQSASEYTNAPSVSYPFLGVRNVYYYDQNNVLVELIELVPDNRRIWVNKWDGSTWNGWQCDHNWFDTRISNAGIRITSLESYPKIYNIISHAYGTTNGGTFNLTICVLSNNKLRVDFMGDVWFNSSVQSTNFNFGINKNDIKTAIGKPNTTLTIVGSDCEYFYEGSTLGVRNYFGQYSFRGYGGVVTQTTDCFSFGRIYASDGATGGWSAKDFFDNSISIVKGYFYCTYT